MHTNNNPKPNQNRTQKQTKSARIAATTATKSGTAGPSLPALPKPATSPLVAEPEPQCPGAAADPQTEALVNSILQSAKTDARAADAAPAAPKAYSVIKLGIDVHADRYVVVRQIDGATPQPAQAFSPHQFVQWAKKQTELAQKVFTCYEAGPFGYGLHRRLTAVGVTNYVVRPRDWDEYGQKVKTDKRDARQLVLHLDRYVNGNAKAFSVVYVPTETEEQARSRSRQREALQREKQRLAAQGRSDGLYYGVKVEGAWWVKGQWEELVAPPIVLELLAPLRRVILTLEQELQASTKALVEAPATQPLPAGLGKLTFEILEREVGDWNRFENRRQVASYTGMCPREDSSDQRRFQGSITKHGNPRVRTPLVEASWRLIRFQPAYKPVAKWGPVLMNPKTTKSKRKQIAVAIGRQFSVDWWRIRTGRCKAEDLGLTLNVAPPVPAPAQAKEAKSTATDQPQLNLNPAVL